MQTIQKAFQVAMANLEKECDVNASMAIKETRKHLLTAELWFSREAAHQEAKSEDSETGP